MVKKTPPMLPDEVRKAVERMDACIEITKPQHTVFCGDKDTYLTIRAHLLAREVEVERLNAAWDSSFKQAMLNGQSAQEQRARAERAEALLRECSDFGVWPSIRDRITAHLSENSRG